MVYDDRDGRPAGQQRLGALFPPCPASGGDCVLGVSAVVLGFRNGQSAELAASPYAFLRAGWSRAIKVPDARRRPTSTGLVSLDGAKSLPFDVALWQDPAAHAVEALDLTVPTVP